MISVETKLERLQALEEIILSKPAGVIRSELARKLDISRSTASRYVDELSRTVPIREVNDGRLVIDVDRYLNNIRLSLDEVMALYLAVALMTTTIDRKNAHAASALRKLGRALSIAAPRIGAQIVADADAVDGGTLPLDPTFVKVLEVITRAWAGTRKVRLSYFSGRHDNATEYVFAPYIVLPYAAGRTLHATGACDGDSGIRTFRLDRIREAVLLSDHYDVPKDFDAQRFFENAWGIWFTDDKPIRVVLRFSSHVAARVKETLWHRSQVIKPQSDGALLWTAHIAEPLEMTPWIRGWGADVEVLQPATLRRSLTEEAAKLAAVYDIGKTRKEKA